MARKKKVKVDIEEEVKVEKIENKKNYTISEDFYYLFGVILSLVLIFATKELLGAVNYLFVVIFAIVAVVQLITFIMNKDYEKKAYSGVVSAIICGWLAMFIFKYGDFLFLEMLPVLLSLLMFFMGISSITKYFDFNRKANLVTSIISFVLGICLIFIPRDIMYVFFKITGVYMFVMLVLDFIDFRKKKRKI